MVYDPVYVVISDTTEGKIHPFPETFSLYAHSSLILLSAFLAYVVKGEGNQLKRAVEVGLATIGPRYRQKTAFQSKGKILCERPVFYLKLIAALGRSFLVPPTGLRVDSVA